MFLDYFLTFEPDDILMITYYFQSSKILDVLL